MELVNFGTEIIGKHPIRLAIRDDGIERVLTSYIVISNTVMWALQGQGTRDKGQGTRDKGQGTRDKGQGTRDKGQGQDKGQFMFMRNCNCNVFFRRARTIDQIFPKSTWLCGFLRTYRAKNELKMRNMTQKAMGTRYDRIYIICLINPPAGHFF